MIQRQRKPKRIGNHHLDLEDEEDATEISPRPGSVELLDEDHSPHSFVYVPDLSQPTGWAAHHVPGRKVSKEPSRIGFRRDVR